MSATAYFSGSAIKVSQVNPSDTRSNAVLAGHRVRSDLTSLTTPSASVAPLTVMPVHGAIPLTYRFDNLSARRNRRDADSMDTHENYWQMLTVKGIFLQNDA